MSAYEGIELPITLGTATVSKSLSTLESVLDALRNIDKSVSSVRNDVNGVGGKMQNEFKKAEKGAESLTDKLGKIGLAIQGIKGIAQGVMGAIQPIFEEGLSRDASVAGLSTLLGSKEDAKRYARELRDEAMSQLYGAGNVTDAARTMMSFGIDSTKTKDMLKAISDIAGGNQQSFNSLVLAFSQATSLGKLQGQDKLQMIGAGFNPLTQIAKDLTELRGVEVTVAEVDEMMSKGLISADMLADAFKNATAEGGTYFGATAEQMGGLNGMIKTIQSSTSDMFATLYEQLTPLAEAVLPYVSDTIRIITETIRGQHPALSALATAIGAVGVALATYNTYMKLAEIRTTILTAKQWLLNIAMDANPVGLVVAAITALVAIVAVCIQKYDEWGAALLMVTGPLGFIVNVIQSIRRNWDDIVNTFRTDGIIAGVKKIGAAILDAIVYPLQQMLSIIGLDSMAGRLGQLRKKLGVNLGGGITPGEEGSSTMGGTADKVSNPINTKNIASGVSSVATGGTRNTSITISMGSLVHQINYQGGIEKNSRETTQDLQEALLRVLNAAANTAG